jgi:integrase
MPRPCNTLTVFDVKNKKKPGRYGDGNGLWLQVQSAERKSWLFRYSFKGKSHEMGLGPYPAVGLAEAREQARAKRALLLQGTDPLAAKRGQASDASPAAMTFCKAAKDLIEIKRSGWRNAKHAQQWENTLTTYAYPVIGDKAARDVTIGDVQLILVPLWTTKHETASRLRGRLEDVLWYAAVKEERQAAYHNPAAWKGNLIHILPKRRAVHREEHHVALPRSAAPDFMARLRQVKGVGARALQWTILTAARSNMTIGATWDEVNEAERVWTVPGWRNKSGEDMRVPLSNAALAVLDGLRPLRRPDQGDFIFPGLKSGQPISNMTMAKVLDRLGMGEDVHGFRSTFRDWVGEETHHAPDVAEAALDHLLPGGKTRWAYQRGDLFGKRIALMKDWARYLCGASMH